ncbi:hypothetical protein LTR99_010153 [Exophiala xenobiotica]|nr:hypothetical protein LTR96_010189 [Exophiala xenobiotica]KAK5293226.1 hypothetical protein LTR99_010153 [Exophiala xenobiotica]KAK5337654.1 hypothetical protein LTR98_006772 [Exophiala xenobiotica]
MSESSCPPHPGLILVQGPISTPADDWSGLADAEERRKRQNRLNQSSSFLTASNGSPTSLPVPEAITELCASNPAPSNNNFMLQFAAFYHSYISGNPSADHRLSLTRMNVYRAFVYNMLLIGITWEWMADDSISPICVTGPPRLVRSLPVTLLPTSLQQTQTHHTWIDLFPLPAMRDNLIQAGNDWDDEELCTDIMGYWDGNAGGGSGLIVWGDPSDPSNWEVTDGFLRKWSWTLRGCYELLQSTNHWRTKRGDSPLRVGNGLAKSSFPRTSGVK